MSIISPYDTWAYPEVVFIDGEKILQSNSGAGSTGSSPVGGTTHFIDEKHMFILGL